MTGSNTRRGTPSAGSTAWKWMAAWAATAVFALLAIAPPAVAQPVKLGEGTYFLSPKAGDKPVPRAPFRTEAMLKRAAPTNQW